MGLQEASVGVYEFADDSKLLVEKLVSFLYTANYDDTVDTPETESSPPISSLQLHARVFALADKYSVSGLSELCIMKYKRGLEYRLDPVEFIQSIPDVYTLTPAPVRALKDVVARFARNRLAGFLSRESARLVYNYVVPNAPGFAKDLLDLYIDAPLLGSCHNCGHFIPVIALQGRCRKCQRGTTSIVG